MVDELPPGNMVLVQGDREVKQFLRTQGARVDDLLYQLVDQMIYSAGERMRELAPGSIKELVGEVPAHETATGAFEGIAGVEPSLADSDLAFGHVGLGSDPADFPVFVEVGTGIFGEVGHSISSMHPDHLVGLMGPILYEGRRIWVHTIQGQRPQRYAGRSFDDLVAQTPVMIKDELQKLARAE